MEKRRSSALHQNEAIQAEENSGNFLAFPVRAKKFVYPNGVGTN